MPSVSVANETPVLSSLRYYDYKKNWTSKCPEVSRQFFAFFSFSRCVYLREYTSNYFLLSFPYSLEVLTFMFPVNLNSLTDHTII